jgi:branched-chain amino acid transport system ATP-binding protein
VAGSFPASGRDVSAVLAMSGVTVEFGRTVALRDVSLEVHPQQVVGVIGPNAAGKSTLLGVARGSVRPTSGHLAWHGTEVTDLRPSRWAKLGISGTTQKLSFDRRKPVLENVMVGADRPARPGPLAGIVARPRSQQEHRELKDRAFAALNDLGIARYAEKYPAGLPSAVQRRVALARALMSQPELLLLDELTSGLSPDERSALGGTLRELTRRTAVVLVEHDMDLLVRVCDHLIVLDAGQVIAQGAPKEVSTDPAVVAAYVEDGQHHGHEDAGDGEPPGWP